MSTRQTTFSTSTHVIASRGCRVRPVLRVLFRPFQLAAAVVICGLAIGLLALLVSMPVDLFLSTIELLRAHEVAEGTIISVRLDDERPVIEYRFRAGRQIYRSNRLMPGFLGGVGGWTTAARFTSRYRAGQRVPVYYRRGNPHACFLEYGWFKWSFAGSCFVVPLFVGMAVVLIGADEGYQPGRVATVVVHWLAALAFTTVMASDGVLYWNRLPLYLLIAVGVGVAVWAWDLRYQKIPS